ncbi:MAG: hypothetical protein HY040_24885 [Planctomycetes bacterium]|nr:hypothetical protein [Planctomycetota bacterium]
MPDLRLATFSCDVTPPVGHPLCGGWIEAVRGVDDPLKALGVVLLGSGQPVVLCAVDWCGLRNEAHEAWRRALAKAVRTSADRVAVHCVHQHNAPFADLEAERLIQRAELPAASLDLRFFDRVVEQVAAAAQDSLARTTPWTHIGHGQAAVRHVASNRRILGADGRVRFTRTSTTRDPKVRAEPEGLIDPQLKTLTFWNEGRPIAALSYYATHPMSYYGDGLVSSDFCGLARERQQDDLHVFQIYFTGCAGNITAGKYNDGNPRNRPVLRDRIRDAMAAAWIITQRHPIHDFTWRSEAVLLPPRTERSFTTEESRRVLANPKESRARRNNAAFQIAWLERIKRPIDITCLDLGPVQVVHLPGEPFIEYQLAGQRMRPNGFVCVAAYGDGGPGYIPTAAAYLEGGYEPTVALAGPRSEAILHQAIANVVNGIR